MAVSRIGKALSSGKLDLQHGREALPIGLAPGACLRVDGAAPNAGHIWPEVGTGGSTTGFDGFHLASTPRVLSEELPRVLADR